MRVATVDGLVTLFYDGSKPLYNEGLIEEWEDAEGNIFSEHTDLEDWNLSDECKRYLRERWSWQQVIVMDGVTFIPEKTFYRCFNIERVVFVDSVIDIEGSAFYECFCLRYIKLPLDLEYIGDNAFEYFNLSSVFIPPRCRHIGFNAFSSNANLEILSVPQDIALVDLGYRMFRFTKLFQRSSFQGQGYFLSANNEAVLNTWLKNINNDETFALHRLCCSFEPTLEMILNVMKDKGGLKAFKLENSIGITPSRYLKENPYAHVEEKEVIEKYVLQMTGEL